jgi:predicted acyl esterase
LAAAVTALRENGSLQAISNRVAFQFDGPIRTCYEFPQFANKEVSMANIPCSEIEPGQRRLNGPQTTGCEYRNLSQPTHAMAQDDDVAVPMRDGVNLLADMHCPSEPGRYPVLVAASPLSTADPKPRRTGWIH